MREMTIIIRGRMTPDHRSWHCTLYQDRHMLGEERLEDKRIAYGFETVIEQSKIDALRGALARMQPRSCDDPLKALVISDATRKDICIYVADDWTQCPEGSPEHAVWALLRNILSPLKHRDD